MALTRRRLTACAAAIVLPAWARDAPAPVLVMRHAQTEPGVGDPPGFVLGQCATQRNLSAEGRAQARAFGARLAALGLRPRELRSSRWCRCLDTADEVARGLGDPGLATRPWTALDSFFGEREREPAQTARLRERLFAARGGGFELWVTHQVNISALAGAGAAMGQALWLTPRREGGMIEARPFE